MVSSMEPPTASCHDQVSETLDKLAKNLDYSVGSYLLLESLRMMNEKANKASAPPPQHGSIDRPLIDPFAISTESGPSLYA